jgi:hypothetical protein
MIIMKMAVCGTKSLFLSQEGEDGLEEENRVSFSLKPANKVLIRVS